MPEVKFRPGMSIQMSRIQVVKMYFVGDEEGAYVPLCTKCLEWFASRVDQGQSKAN